MKTSRFKQCNQEAVYTEQPRNQIDELERRLAIRDNRIKELEEELLGLYRRLDRGSTENEPRNDPY